MSPRVQLRSNGRNNLKTRGSSENGKMYLVIHVPVPPTVTEVKINFLTRSISIPFRKKILMAPLDFLTVSVDW